MNYKEGGTAVNASLPSRERGLKFTTSSDFTAVSIVAPLAGAWVEIEYTVGLTLEYLSLPSRERGLKLSFE